MIALIALLAQVTAPITLPGLGITPTPAPTAPPIITTIETRAVCTALRKTVTPVAYIAKHNDAAFQDVVTRAANVGQKMTSDQTDFQFLARRYQSNVGEVLTNMDLAQKLLDESRKQYPDDRDPYVAAMRAQLENVLYYQKQYNSMIDAISGAYLDAQSNKQLYGGFYAQDTQEVQQRRLLSEQDFINGNRALMGLPPLEGLAFGSDGKSVQAYQQIQDQSQLTQGTPNGGPDVLTQIRDGLKSSEGQLAETALAAQRMCSAPPKKKN